MKEFLVALATLLTVLSSCGANKPNNDIPEIPYEPQPSVETKDHPRDGKCRVAVKDDAVYVSTYMDEQNDMLYVFKKCMYNELFTFYTVGSAPNQRTSLLDPTTEPKVVYNQTSSDNIGPFGIESYCWVGGNHSYRELNKNRTAKNLSWKVLGDGSELKSGDIKQVKSLVIEVENELYDPQYDINAFYDHVLIKEKYQYIVENNSIRVNGEHTFSRDISSVCYYGMQSMFLNETGMLTPASKFSTWQTYTSNNSPVYINKTEDPEFRHFVERRSSEAFQTTYLLNTGIGTHEKLDYTKNIFIANSWTKHYHVQMYNSSVKEGETTNWSGVYTWTLRPLVDDEKMFCHTGMIDGRHAVYVDFLQSDERSISVPEHWTEAEDCTIELYEGRGEGLEYSLGEDGKILLKATGPAYMILLI